MSDIIRSDTVYRNVTMRFGFMDRVRILMGRPLHVHTHGVIDCVEGEHGLRPSQHVAVSVYVDPIFRRRSLSVRTT